MNVESVLGDWYDENTFVVSSGKECLIIDTGAKLEKVLSLIDDKKVVGILLTHGHFDHSLYLKEYADKFACKIYGSDKLEETLRDHTLNQSESWELNQKLDIVRLEKDGRILIGGFEVEYFASSGHSPCGECYKINDLLFAGDTIFNSGIGRLDLKGSDKNAMIKTIEKMSKVEFKTLYSGHGEESDYNRQKRNIGVFLRFLKR